MAYAKTVSPLPKSADLPAVKNDKHYQNAPIRVNKPNTNIIPPNNSALVRKYSIKVPRLASFQKVGKSNCNKLCSTMYYMLKIFNIQKIRNT